MTKKNSWYKDIIIKTLKKERRSFQLIFTVVFLLFLLVWNKFTGKTFSWEWIDSISVPPYVRLFYSALVFVSLGAVLYATGFYKILYQFFVGFLGDFKTYKEVKALIWIGLIALMYFKIIPWVVDILNILVSIGYNVLNLILYIFPALGVSLILGILITLFFHKRHHDLRL